MKKVLLIMIFFCSVASQAQEQKLVPQISVSGEGKIKAIPDQVFISIAVETKGTNATDVKKQNDTTIEKVLQFITKFKVPKSDVQTKSVSLNPQYDYEKKKRNYNATQTIEILLKNILQYDALMEGLVDAGINRINLVEFKTSKLTEYQSEARKLAMKEAKSKAEDYVSVLGQKVGKAITITDNTQNYYPQPMYAMKTMAMDQAESTKETIAIGEINITATVNVSFLLE
jgi:uncharacterized protein YggE